MNAVPLHEIAHARAGDKDDTLNVSVIVYDPVHFETVRDQVTPERVRAAFAGRKPARVTRYELPRLGALNFVVEGVLEGGVNASLNLDGHGKSHSFAILALTVEI